MISKGELEQFFAKFRPEILCIQETKARPEQVKIPDLIAENYQVFWNSAEKKGYAGTAIFVKNNFAKPQNTFYDLPGRLADRYDFAEAEFGNPNFEGRVLTLEFANFYLVDVYTPNAKDKNLRLDTRAKKWDPAFRDYLSELRTKKPVIFCGDLNVAREEIDLANPKGNVGKHGFTVEERTGISNILDAGFIDSFREKFPDAREKYTWWSHWAHARENNRGWRIDYFCVDRTLKAKILDAEIYPNQLGSDHCPVSVTVEL